MLQVSALPETYGRQSYVVSVGSLPNFTYMSASPVPPDITNFRPVAPAGTTIVYFTYAPVAPEMFDTVTPLLSTLPPVLPPLTVTGNVLLLVRPPLSVTVSVTL